LLRAGDCHLPCVRIECLWSCPIGDELCSIKVQFFFTWPRASGENDVSFKKIPPNSSGPRVFLFQSLVVPLFHGGLLSPGKTVMFFHSPRLNPLHVRRPSPRHPLQTLLPPFFCHFEATFPSWTSSSLPKSP